MHQLQQTRQGDRHEKKRSEVIGPFVFMISLAVYLVTTSPTVYLGDSGEFIASAFCLGNPHNSGYPLYTLIGKIFCLLPLGNVAFRMNVMSALFAAATAWLTYAIIVRMTRSTVSACSAALLLAFSITLWSQTGCAEVYAFHAFFVALILRLLFWWNETRSLKRLLVFSFVVALSFTNHLQTLMLAPAVFMFIVSSDRRILFNLHHCLLLTFFFLLGLSVYLYLPVRTEAGTMIHWGNPDTFSGFLHHVGAADHRNAYVFTKSWHSYLSRFLTVLDQTYRQFHVFWVLAVLGWFVQKGLKWKTFWGLLFLLDLTYTLFLNIISTEITAFQIPSTIFGAILIGLGLNSLLRRIADSSGHDSGWLRCSQGACVLCPLALLVINGYANDQHTNYTAYEFGINTLRSTPSKATLLIEGDNIVFPITYLALVENARPDLTLYDRHNLFFKMPFLYTEGPTFHGKWADLRRIIEKELVISQKDVYVSVFNEKALKNPGFDLIPHGFVARAVPSQDFETALREEVDPWPHYMETSFNDTFYRDYMNRSVTGYFFFKLGRHLIFRELAGPGIKMMNAAASVAFNDRTLHGDMGAFLIDVGMLDEAKKALERFSKHTNDRGRLHNMWGYYYSKTGDFQKAITAFEKSVRMNASLFDAYRNLGLMYLKVGKHDQARQAFEKSLTENPKQPKLIRLMEEKGWS